MRRPAVSEKKESGTLFKILVVLFSLCVVIWTVFNMSDDISQSFVKGFSSESSDTANFVKEASAELLHALKRTDEDEVQIAPPPPESAQQPSGIDEYIPDIVVSKPEPDPVLQSPSKVVPVESPSTAPAPAPIKMPLKPKTTVYQGSKNKGVPPSQRFARYASIPIKPVLGVLATNGSRPLSGRAHKGTDAVFALAAKYPKLYYQRFVGSLRKFGFKDDIVLGVSPPREMKPGVEAYLESQGVLAYGFEVDCKGKDNCRLKDEFLGYPDPRPHRTFANIRYALYEYWMQYYSYQSYILILDFRDTFFQGNPFEPYGYPVRDRVPTYDLQVFAENYKVKNIGKCVFNSGWVGDCFGRSALEKIKHLPVICSGSTMGSYAAVRNYLSVMLAGMDKIQCWRKGIESDQGYQNNYFHNGHFDTPEGKAVMNAQGYGRVNTIGAMNGFRVPAHMKGPLDTFWKIIDSDGFVLNYDGTRSSCVHQWDRFDSELRKFVDSGKLYDR